MNHNIARIGEFSCHTLPKKGCAGRLDMFYRNATFVTVRKHWEILLNVNNKLLGRLLLFHNTRFFLIYEDYNCLATSYITNAQIDLQTSAKQGLTLNIIVSFTKYLPSSQSLHLQHRLRSIIKKMNHMCVTKQMLFTSGEAFTKMQN